MIEYHDFPSKPEAKFSIIIPTWNNLPYLKSCIHSIEKNSTFKHEIIVHVNEGGDGTAQWLQQHGYKHTVSNNNIGICWALNSAYSLARCDYIVYMNDDMYACPEWDLYLWQEVESIGHTNFYLSSTLIEHTATGNACVAAPHDFGQDIDNFNEKALLDAYQSIEFADWVGTTWPPNVLHRKLWDAVGGFSVEFSPGMYSDPDLAMKLWQAGVRYFKGVGKSKVYHFQAKSTGKVKRNNGRKQFLRKWGISSSTFTKHCLHRGEAFRMLENPKSTKFKSAQLKDSIKRRFVNDEYSDF